MKRVCQNGASTAILALAFSLAVGCGGRTTVEGEAAVPSGGAGGACGAGGRPTTSPESDGSASLIDVVNQPSDFGNPLTSAWFISGCKQQVGRGCQLSTTDCPNTDAATLEQRGRGTDETFPLRGAIGQNYKLTFGFNAIVEAGSFTGGSRDAGQSGISGTENEVLDTFYRDGMPRAAQMVWKLAVFDATGRELRHFYMNSLPDEEELQLSANTLLVSYTKAIVISGGGQVHLSVRAPGCFVADNCGPPSGSCAPSNLPNEATELALPAMYRDMSADMLVPTHTLSVASVGGTQPWHSQIGHLRVLRIEETEHDVNFDYL